MLLQMVEQGRVHLADPVAKYFPEISLVPTKYPWAPPITLIQLATMSSGLQANPSSLDDPYAVGPPSEWRKQLVAALPHEEYAYEPGTSRLYSNVSYAIRLPHWNGLPACPIWNTSSRRSGAARNDEHAFLCVARYLRAPRSRLRPRRRSNQLCGRPAPKRQYGLLDTGRRNLFQRAGLAKLMRFQMGYGPNTVLQPATLESSFHLLVASDADLLYGDSVGYSVVRNEDGYLVALGHGGLRHGYVASYEFDRSAKTGVIVLSSRSAGNAKYKPLVRKILSMLNPASRGGTGEPLQEPH